MKRTLRNNTRVEVADGNKLNNSAWTLKAEYFRQTMSRKDYKSTLLATDGRIFRQGEIYNIKGRHLGAGVYEVTLELAIPR